MTFFVATRGERVKDEDDCDADYEHDRAQDHEHDDDYEHDYERNGIGTYVSPIRPIGLIGPILLVPSMKRKFRNPESKKVANLLVIKALGHYSYGLL